MRVIKIFIKVMFVITFTMCAFLSYTAWSIWHFGTQDQRTQADAAIVLGAAAWHTTPSPVFLERIRHGIWLYEQDYVDYLIFTGGKGDGAPYSEAYVAKLFAINAGVPEESILMEEFSRNTSEHFHYLDEIIAEHGIKSVLIVSDPLHMKRGVRLAEDVGLQAYSSPTPTTRYETTTTTMPFLFREVFYYIGYRIKTIINI